MRMYEQRDLKKALLVLKDPNIIEQICIVSRKKTGCAIYFGMSTSSSQRHQLHFIIDADRYLSNDIMAPLLTAIRDALGLKYYHEYEGIMVLNKNDIKEDSFPEHFIDLTLISKENFAQVQTFLQNHFLKFITNTPENHNALSKKHKKTPPQFWPQDNPPESSSGRDAKRARLKDTTPHATPSAVKNNSGGTLH